MVTAEQSTKEKTVPALRTMLSAFAQDAAALITKLGPETKTSKQRMTYK